MVERENSDHDTTQVPYRFDDNTPEEMEILDKFMHADFPHVTYSGGRNMDVIIEYPPPEICSPSEWKRILDKVFLPDWKSFDIVYRRTITTIVRFAEKLYDPEVDFEADGTSFINGGENWNFIVLKDEDGAYYSPQNLMLTIMHELSEVDFWFKTNDGDEEANVTAEEELAALENDTYEQLLDEKIASRRALRAVRRVWPEANWRNKEDRYEEDEEKSVV